MIPYLGCEAAREMLQSFVDGELPMAEQVALESHLRWCKTCRARVEDMRLIGAALRLGSAAPAINPADAGALATIHSDVLMRVRAERAESFAEWFRDACTDMRYLWPMLGATAALIACLSAVTTMSRVTRVELPDSIADKISTLANPGSDRNPVHLDSRMLAPRTLNDAPALDSIPEEEAVFALAAVITREGRVAKYQLLQSVRARVLRRWTAAESDDVDPLLDAVKRARFTPARTSDGAVAVNMVWVLARTTVKGSIEANDLGVFPSFPAAEKGEKPLNAGLARPVLRHARS